MEIRIDMMEFIFLFIGYGLALIEFGYYKGWWLIGLMIVAMFIQFNRRTDLIIRR